MLKTRTNKKYLTAATCERKIRKREWGSNLKEIRMETRSKNIQIRDISANSEFVAHFEKENQSVKESSKGTRRRKGSGLINMDPTVTSPTQLGWMQGSPEEENGRGQREE